jgi:hypothetical protein
MTKYFLKPFIKNSFLLYILLLSGITWVLSRYPGHNGDMPFYIVCAIEKEQGSMDGAVAKTQAVLQKELPAEEFIEHAQRIGREDPMIFERYRIKPFYILLILAFHKLGFSYVHATIIPSLLCYFLIGLSIWQVAIKKLDPFHCLLVCFTCCIIYPTLVLARLSSPDALSCFIVLNALFLIYSGRRKTLWICLFLLAIVTRLDNIVFEFFFLFALWKWPVAGFKNKLNFKEFAGLSFILGGMALLVNLTSTHHFFWFMDPHFSEPPGQYWNDMSIYLFIIPGSFFMYLLVLFIISGLRRGFSWKLEVNFLFYVISAIIFIRFLIYPYFEERYIAPLLLFSLLTISFDLARSNKNLKKGSAQSV